MNANATVRLLGIVMATSLVSAAIAMDMSQPAPAGDGRPALRLPAFLDMARLPDLQDAWRLHSAVPAAATDTGENSLDTAREALTRAEHVSREAAAVRERAEELSRRFGAEAAGTSGAGTPGAATSTETAAMEAESDASASAPTVEHVLAPADDAAAGEPDASEPAAVPPRPMRKRAAMADQAPVVEDMATQPARTVRRYNSSVGVRQITQAGSTRMPTAGLMVVDVSPTAPDSDTSKMVPTELRSMGWNAQP